MGPQKSPNVLLTKTDEAKIGDVGLGKLIHGADTTATQMGTFMWASPEQLMGGAASTASDIYRCVRPGTVDDRAATLTPCLTITSQVHAFGSCLISDLQRCQLGRWVFC